MLPSRLPMAHSSTHTPFRHPGDPTNPTSQALRWLTRCYGPYRTFTTALAASLIIDDLDLDVAAFRDNLETDHGHDVTLSPDFVLEREFTGDFTAPDGSELALDDYDGGVV